MDCQCAKMGFRSWAIHTASSRRDVSHEEYHRFIEHRYRIEARAVERRRRLVKGVL